jgi:hypothetical protein
MAVPSVNVNRVARAKIPAGKPRTTGRRPHRGSAHHFILPWPLLRRAIAVENIGAHGLEIFRPRIPIIEIAGLLPDREKAVDAPGYRHPRRQAAPDGTDQARKTFLAELRGPGNCIFPVNAQMRRSIRKISV